MIKPHIAIIVAPFYGHTNPILPIISELIRSGFRVTCPITARFADEFSAVGAEPILYKSVTPDKAQKACSIDELSKLIADYCVVDQIAIFEQTAALYDVDRPDLIVHGSANLVGRVFAAKFDVPAVQLFESFADNHVFSLFEAIFGKNHPCMLEMQRKLQLFLDQANVSMQEYLNAEARRYIVFNSRTFQYEGNTFDHNFHFVGPCLRHSNHEGNWFPPKEKGRPILYISLGTVFTDALDFFRACVEAFADKEWHVVMAIGNAVDPAALGDLPAHIEVHRHVPQLAVLQHADVFISHSGMNSTMEALYHGVPLVLVPQMPEQELVAKRVVQLGLGKLTSGASISAIDLYETVSQVYGSAEIAARTQQMQYLVRHAGGAKVAVRVIKNTLRDIDLNAPIAARAAIGA